MNVFTYRATGVENLDSVELGLLGYTVCLGSDRTGAVGTMTVSVSVGTIASIVGEEGSAALEFGMRCVDTSVNDVGASTGTSTAVVGVGSATTILVGDASKTPSR
jgi:hypothetical protein